MKLVLVGQAITEAAEAGKQLAPLHYNKTGSRICRLLDINEDQYYNYFDRVNIWPWVDGPKPTIELERYQVLNLMGVLAGRQCVLLGSNVARRFGLADNDYAFCQWYAHLYNMRDYALGLPLPFDWAVIPHPSGKNRWYNDLTNTEMVARFLRQAIGRG